jgi:hypothetical protein
LSNSAESEKVRPGAGCAILKQRLNMEVIVMRELNKMELDFVSGGVVCHANDYGGISNTSSVGQDLINIYEGLVAATSHVIERVANAF